MLGINEGKNISNRAAASSSATRHVCDARPAVSCNHVKDDVDPKVCKRD